MKDAAKSSVAQLQGIDKDEQEQLVEVRMEKLEEFTKKWIDCMEYVTIEFDTEAQTATVVNRK